MNPNYEVLEQILKLDGEAGAASQDWRAAQKELTTLAEKTKLSEELISKTRTDLVFMESELRRAYKRADDLEERKGERSAKLFAAKDDDEHRSVKREVDHIERDLRDTTRRADEIEGQIERLKDTFFTAEESLASTLAATSEEREKAHKAQNDSSGRLTEIEEIRKQHLSKLESRLQQHYSRVAQISRNPNGPVVRVEEKACGNCRMELAPQMMNMILKGAEVQICPSCNHILLPPLQ